jgi:hypothetical protein
MEKRRHPKNGGGAIAAFASACGAYRQCRTHMDHEQLHEFPWFFEFGV